MRHGQHGGKAQQLAPHQQQALALGHRARRDHGDVDEDTRQIEQTSKPAGYEDDMEGFDPEHAVSVKRAGPQRLLQTLALRGSKVTANVG